MNIKENTIVTAKRFSDRVTTYRVTTHNIGEFEAVYGTRVNSKTWKDSYSNNLEILTKNTGANIASRKFSFAMGSAL